MARQKQVSWDDTFYVSVYEARRSGLNSIAKCAKALDISPGTLAQWLEDKPALQDAWDRGGKASVLANFSFRDYVYDRLPPQLQKVWNSIRDCENDAQGATRLGELLGSCSKEARQRLFLYAFVDSGFNGSEARKICGLTKSQVTDWYNTDPRFSDLMAEIEEAKKDFFEKGLVDLVRQGHAGAIMFVNKTYNKDRGYGESRQIEITGSVEHKHTMIAVTDLPLPLELKLQVLEAYRSYAQENDLPLLSNDIGEEEDILEGEYAE